MGAARAVARKYRNAYRAEPIKQRWIFCQSSHNATAA